ncbi:MAG: hypothetical protein AUI10_06885 [Actinobacteria bacterium 13_2_20CM_2_72_6]|nr:MAG: hypothetical protein AUI10_06885 [Actinobacteria bacterium 13_2_20CM_2_72_6]
MLAGDAPVVRHQRFHRLGEVEDGDRAVDLYPPSAEEAVGKYAEIGARVAAQVPHLVRGLPAADHRVPRLVHTHRDRAELRRAVRAPGGQDRPVLAAQQLTCLIEIHASIVARLGMM